MINAVEESVSFVNNNYKPKSTTLDLNIVSVIEQQQKNGENTIGEFKHNNGVNPNILIASTVLNNLQQSERDNYINTLSMNLGYTNTAKLMIYHEL